MAVQLEGKAAACLSMSVVAGNVSPEVFLVFLGVLASRNWAHMAEPFLMLGIPSTLVPPAIQHPMLGTLSSATMRRHTSKSLMEVFGRIRFQVVCQSALIGAWAMALCEAI